MRQAEEARKKKGLPAEDAWFWHPFVILPKASYNANIYLLQDDVPNFLRFWMNAYASMVGADGKLWEHGIWAITDPCTAPDNGTAGWFMENFRDMLVMEEGKSLWIARATPRVWLEQGKKIAVRNAPTYFGPLAYEIVSDVDHGQHHRHGRDALAHCSASRVAPLPPSEGGGDQERNGQRPCVE